MAFENQQALEYFAIFLMSFAFFAANVWLLTKKFDTTPLRFMASFLIISFLAAEGMYKNIGTKKA